MPELEINQLYVYGEVPPDIVAVQDTDWYDSTSDYTRSDSVGCSVNYYYVSIASFAIYEYVPEGEKATAPGYVNPLFIEFTTVFVAVFTIKTL